ncbi:MAG: RagB/SusD family nutrient uptake outer membrane protein [Bacteroides sp.]|nr:RagB/SusD family nutrient uptake outer membrane protein [Bacteroides sp.]
MKRYITILTALLAISGCTYLDKMPDDQKTDEMVWTSRTEVNKYLTNCYAGLRNECRTEQDPWVAMGDDMEICNANLVPYRMCRGDWSPTAAWYPDRWSLYYKAIRSTFVFENNIHRCDELSSTLKSRYVGETTFLRGYYYFDLLRLYGPAVLLKSLPSNDADFSSMARAPFDECIEYVVECLDKAEELLPAYYAPTDDDCGRATKVACRAIKAQALLLAASEQWNGNDKYLTFRNNDGTPLANTTYDPAKWQRAADAAKAVIDMAEANPEYIGLYTNGDVSMDSAEFNPFKSFYDLFNVGWNKEILFGSIYAVGGHCGRSKWMQYCIPVNKNGFSQTVVGVTLKLVDAFYMENGRDKDDPASGYTEEGLAKENGPHFNPNGHDLENDPKGEHRTALLKDYKNLVAWGHSAGDGNIYANREARFYATVNYNHRIQLVYSIDKQCRDNFNSAGQQDGFGRVEMYYGGVSNTGETDSYSRTGMTPQKFIVPNESQTSFVPTGKYVNIHVRYGEILLDYIEALNEVNPSHPDIKKYWDLIRKRGGLPSIYNTVSGLSGNKDRQREYIIRERQIELALEGDRYFTMHRRLLAGPEHKKDGGWIWGMSVRAGDPKTNNFNTLDFYRREKINQGSSADQRVWKDAYYLFPILQTEIDKSTALVQNPGW